MLELTPDFIKEFAAYLTAERNLKNATIWLNCMWLKGVVMRAHYNGLIPRNPFVQFHISPNVKEREYLTEDEIKTIMSHEFESPTLTLVRDLFVFACFTALSFVDMKELTTNEIVEVNGEKWIIGKRHKTNVPFQVKLLDIPLQIIERYKHLSEDKLVFGEINYWAMCKQLKRVIKECGIEKQISYHCARHTFGTLALTKGMPIESVSRVLGHTNIVTTQIYAKITTQKLDNDLTMFGDKLNKVFNDVSMDKIMERAVITMNEHGAVFVPNGEIWMSEMELTDLLGVIAPTVRAAIRAVYKSGVLKEHEAQKYIRLENGYNADAYNFPIIVALAFRIHSYGTNQVRNALMERMYLRKEKASIFFSLNMNDKVLPVN